MKKLLAILISILLIFSLCCCTNNSISKENTQTGTENIIKEGSDSPGKQKDETQTPNSPTLKSETGKTEISKNDEHVSQIATPPKPEIEKIELPDVNNFKTNHTALSKDSYYQYSFLNDTEKSLYNKFFEAATKCRTVVDLTNYKLTEKQVKKVYDAFIADCPQFFYISKHSTFIIDANTKYASEFIMQYTDGENYDDYDIDGNPISVADRTTIKNQISEFSATVSAILSLIPSDISELERERKIYDYIVKTTVYDYEAENSTSANQHMRAASFSAFGAACKGKAVCEGYVKLFQLICYNVGINATQIESTSDMHHMWNAVKIGNNWYMADLTWDDSDDLLSCFYNYFNVTTEFIKKDHSIAYDLKVPLCNSTESSFYNNFAIVPNVNTLPKNYKQLVYNALLNGDEFLFVYRGEDSKDLINFVDTNIINGEIAIYLISYGYTTGDEYYHTDTYYFIPIIKESI